MTLADLLQARAEALRFIDRLDRLVDEMHAENATYCYGSPASGAVRRASLDLTRALARMRRRTR